MNPNDPPVTDKRKPYEPPAIEAEEVIPLEPCKYCGASVFDCDGYCARSGRQ